MPGHILTIKKFGVNPNFPGFVKTYHLHTRGTYNNYMYFSKVKLQLQVNNFVYMLGILSITTIIAEINLVGM